MDNREFKKQLEERTMQFAVQVVKFCMHLRKFKIPEVLVTQLLKSGTSIGANYREANRAESKNDFIHKIAISEKEASETDYWLDVFKNSEIINVNITPDFCILHKEAKELLAIFNSISRNSKNLK